MTPPATRPAIAVLGKPGTITVSGSSVPPTEAHSASSSDAATSRRDGSLPWDSARASDRSAGISGQQQRRAGISGQQQRRAVLP
jgi:hypothetical protein